MAEKEHPAAVAGKYLRAAGIAIQKELERRAAESDAAKAAPASEAAAPPATDTPQPTPAAARRGRAAKPPLEPKPLVDRLLWFLFLLAMLSLALSGLQVQMLASESSATMIRLVLGVPLLLVAILVLTNWQRANERLVARAFRTWGIEAPTTKSGRLVRRFAKDMMTLVGIVLLAVAAFQLLSAVVN